MTKLQPIINDILREIYEEAEPGLDYDHLRKNPDEYPDDWYDQHYLDGDRQDEIVEKHTTDLNLTEKEHTKIIMTCILSRGPRSFRREE